MQYDFDTVINRKNTNSLKFDFAAERGKPEGLLPMWVADMDFPAPPEVLDDLRQAVAHGIFGYTEAKDPYDQAVIQWFATRYGFTFARQDIIKTPGVVFALAQCVRAFSEIGDSVIIQVPVYYPFYAVVQDNARKLVTNPLVYRAGRYAIDFNDFERKIKDHQVKLFILCSPHNPVARVWTPDELARLNEICTKHGVIVVSDEIHCDFTHPGHTHTCFGLLNERAIIATAPSKTFNLAGLQVANLIIKDTQLHRQLKEEVAKSGYSQLNTLGLLACQSAYTHGGPWLEQLNAYLAKNIRFVKDFLTEHLPKVSLIEPEGTYLLWLDFSAYGLTQAELDRRIIHGAKLWLDHGTMFGAEGEGFERINVACPIVTLQEACARLYREFR
ncbi:MAG: pyridoxal phosphate-dependent aminotransferase [Peptococcaceae bacterium]|nr:pyridoxal phosphate-dependent aminotransferase [Peptococcaceae bacterium]